MVVIRLARGGSKKRPFYNIIVADNEKQERIRIAADRLNHWVAQGAQVSEAVAKLVKEQKVAA